MQKQLDSQLYKYSILLPTSYSSSLRKENVRVSIHAENFMFLRNALKKERNSRNLKIYTRTLTGVSATFKFSETLTISWFRSKSSIGRVPVILSEPGSCFYFVQMQKYNPFILSCKKKCPALNHIGEIYLHKYIFLVIFERARHAIKTMVLGKVL